MGQVEECGCCLNVFGGEEGVTVAESNSVSILGGESLIKLDWIYLLLWLTYETISSSCICLGLFGVDSDTVDGLDLTDANWLCGVVASAAVGIAGWLNEVWSTRIEMRVVSGIRFGCHEVFGCTDWESTLVWHRYPHGGSTAELTSRTKVYVWRHQLSPYWFRITSALDLGFKYCSDDAVLSKRIVEDNDNQPWSYCRRDNHWCWLCVTKGVLLWRCFHDLSMTRIFY